ncbi:MAG: DUF1573 domain-containing protein [Moheibacter sp.]
MKAIKISLLALTLAAVPVSYAASNHVQNLVQNVVDSVISWKSTTLEVGEIPQGQPYTIKFEFKNTTDKPVLITNVKASCGCTATDYTKEVIKPKKSGYVNAVYNAANEGAFTKTVTVTTSDSETPTKLTFKGKVVKK